MPELPEVETIKSQLNEILPGQTIESVEIINPKSFQGNRQVLIGKRVKSLDRLGKLLIMRLFQNLALTVHLKMTGQLLYYPPKMSHNIKRKKVLPRTLPDKHTRIIINFKN